MDRRTPISTTASGGSTGLLFVCLAAVAIIGASLGGCLRFSDRFAVQEALEYGLRPSDAGLAYTMDLPALVVDGKLALIYEATPVIVGNATHVLVNQTGVGWILRVSAQGPVTLKWNLQGESANRADLPPIDPHQAVRWSTADANTSHSRPTLIATAALPGLASVLTVNTTIHFLGGGDSAFRGGGSGGCSTEYDFSGEVTAGAARQELSPLREASTICWDGT